MCYRNQHLLDLFPFATGTKHRPDGVHFDRRRRAFERPASRVDELHRSRTAVSKQLLHWQAGEAEHLQKVLTRRRVFSIKLVLECVVPDCLHVARLRYDRRTTLLPDDIANARLQIQHARREKTLTARTQFNRGPPQTFRAQNVDVVREYSACTKRFDQRHAVSDFVFRRDIHIGRHQRAQVVAKGDVGRRAVV